MVGVLVGVALVSAAVGAAVMVVLLRCRKFKILPSGRDSCPMLMRGTWTKGSATTATTGGDGVAGERGGTEAIKGIGEAAPGGRAGGGTTNTGWSMKLWRRGSSQERPLRPSSSQGSENSYTEEPYVNADAQSAVYAELNSTTASTPGSVTSGGAAYRPYSLNTYSEIPDPLRPVSLRAYISESTYENAGYVISEAGLEQPESSAGSTSTPSSAYYSDVSSSETHNNKKKKKKRKNEERSSTGLQRCLELPNISSSVAIMNRHNLLAGRGGAPPANSIHPPLHTREILPLALELLPQHLALDARGGESVLPPLQPNMAVIHTASQVQTLPNNKGPNEPRPVASTCPRNGGPAGVTAPLPGVSVGGPPGVTTPGPEEAPGAAGVPTSITGQGPGVAAAQPESLPVSLAEEGEDEDSSHRPLPPLPSRQQQGPQRRGVYLAQSKQDQPLPPVPSEYV
ncbi:uncharacterized protein LOC135115033 isoform X1 [Scylla paramamosain]|uniref:uncharacterized protein LOC135115033 isoform X1 n=1 Tax=Scylla paramamosain TaxID=85552 RepID=UPI003082B444